MLNVEGKIIPVAIRCEGCLYQLALIDQFLQVGIKRIGGELGLQIGDTGGEAAGKLTPEFVEGR